MMNYYLIKYLEARPMFLAAIRVPEAALYNKYSAYIKNLSLDFGCGDGFFAETVFGKNKIDIGLDIKNERSEKIIAKNIYKKVVFYDGKKIPFTNNYFRTVISNCVLEHVADINSAVAEIYRVLKPGGFFIATVMADKWNNYMFGRKIFGQLYVNYMEKRQVHLNLFSYNKWSEFFKSNGFKIIKSAGYLDEKYSQFLDLAHYLSLPSLISFKLFNTWQPFPKLNNFLWNKYLTKKINIKVDTKKSSALFFCLKK